MTIVDDDVAAAPDFEKRRAALAALKQHPRDSDAVKTILARGARCYEDALGDVRQMLGDQITRFQMVVEGQDPREIQAAITQMTEVLDRFEGQTWL
ncbi:MAG: hypothetical protein EON86_12790 [Brevundimonas sp.]|nr:MAG: hypothetical protein EON86_12790 [Brevundimonas sp.]